MPAMVIPVCDLDGGLGMTPAECPVCAPPGVSIVVAQPPMVTSPAGPTVVSPGFLQPSTGSVSCSSVPLTIPAVSTPEKSLLFQAAEMDQGQPWSGSSLGGESAGCHLPAAPRPLVRRLRLITMVNRTQLGGTRTSLTCLVKGRLMSTRTIRMPSYRVRRAAHYMTAMGLWRPPITPEIRGPLPLATCNACMSCSDCFPDVPL